MMLSARPETPFLAIDMAAFERNVERMADTIVRKGGKRWRPHVKAIKTPALAQKLIAAGARGVTCAKLSEAEVMVAGGIDDVLIANQLVGAAKVRLLAEHTCIELESDNDRPHIGDSLRLAVGYSDSTVFLHDVIHAERDGRIEHSWPVAARGKLW